MNDTTQTILDRLNQVTADLYACFDRQARLVHETEMLRQQLALLATPWPREAQHQRMAVTTHDTTGKGTTYG